MVNIKHDTTANFLPLILNIEPTVFGLKSVEPICACLVINFNCSQLFFNLFLLILLNNKKQEMEDEP